MDSKTHFKQMHEEISSTLDGRIDLITYDARKSNSERQNELPQNLKEFYKSLSHLNYEWETKELVNKDGQKLMGRINILKAEAVMNDWDGVIYFKDHGDTGDITRFKPVDFFVPEACAGFLLEKQSSDAMYYLDLGDNEVQPMNIDFNGYLELMFMARGFWYWQRVVLTLAGGDYTRNVEQFKTYMPQIFPDFKWEEFVALYERVKIT